MVYDHGGAGSFKYRRRLVRTGKIQGKGAGGDLFHAGMRSGRQGVSGVCALPGNAFLQDTASALPPAAHDEGISCASGTGPGFHQKSHHGDRAPDADAAYQYRVLSGLFTGSGSERDRTGKLSESGVAFRKEDPFPCGELYPDVQVGAPDHPHPPR